MADMQLIWDLYEFGKVNSILMDYVVISTRCFLNTEPCLHICRKV
jgi:hypothetical protein